MSPLTAVSFSKVLENMEEGKELMVTVVVTYKVVAIVVVGKVCSIHKQ